MVRVLVEALRPWQWTKNLLLFAPLVFAHRWADGPAALRASLAFADFCVLASGFYLVNDLLDREADRNHGVKRARPIASGALPARTATIVAMLCVGLALAGAAALAREPESRTFWVWPLAYAVLTLAYSFRLKHVVVVDCLCIALGFVIRVLAGSAAAGVESSSWILLCTFFFALFLAYCKRREEVARHGELRGDTRISLRDYDLPFLDQLIAPLAALSILSYALYTVAPETLARHHGNRNLMITVPFVIFGVFRYLFLVHRKGAGMDPARMLFRDVHLLASGLLWLLSVYVALSSPALL